MRKSFILTFGIMLLLLLTSTTLLAKPQRTSIILKAIDFGEVKHIEYVPRLFYKARSLTCSEVAKELLLKTLYNLEVDESKLNFILTCKHNGYFSRVPSSNEFDAESTLYAVWLLKILKTKVNVNATFLLEELKKVETFNQAYYIIMTLKLLGYNISRKLLKDFDLGYAVSWVKNSGKPSLRATSMWLCLFPDKERALWLIKYAQGISLKVRAKIVLGSYSYEDLAKLDYSNWFNIETLIVFRPTFVNTTIVPKVIIREEPKIASIRIVRWPNQIVNNYSFTWSLEGSKIVSILKIDNRILTFKHYLAREEVAYLEIKQIKFGLVRVKCTYKPPYTLRLLIGGLEFILEGNDYNCDWILEVLLVGKYEVRAIIKSSGSILVGEGVIKLEASYEKTLLDYAWLGLPLLSTVIALSGIPNKRKMLKLGVPVLVIQVIPTYYAYEILRLHPIWFTLISGVILLTITRLVSKESFDICLSHIIVITTLCIASMITSNPVVLLLGGIGSGLFLTSAILYPSERDRTERLYKSTMIIYSLGILIMNLVNQLAVQIASFLYIPDEAFIDSIRVQTMFIANIIALTPIIAPLIHLARLIHAFERIKEAEAIIRQAYS